MQYRQLGSTGLSVGEIGLGCEGFLNKSWDYTKEVFDLALENGVNCMDLYSPDPDMQRRVGRAIAPVRDRFEKQCEYVTLKHD